MIDCSTAAIGLLPIAHPHAALAVAWWSARTALDLLRHMLDYDTARRYTAEQCLAHPYFADLRDVTLEVRLRSSPCL